MNSIKTIKSVLMISHSSNKSGGGEDDFQKLLENFNQKGYTIYSVFPDGYRTEIYKSLSNRYLILPDNIFPFVGFNLKKYILFFHFFLKKIPMMLHFFYDIKKNVNIAFVNSSVCIPEIFALNIVGIPYVLSIKEITNPVLVRRLLYKYIDKSAREVIVISEYMKKLVSKYIPLNKLILIRSSIDERLCSSIKGIQKVKNGNEFVISTLGVITPVKNQMMLLESLKNVENNKIILLNIIGRVEDTSYYRILKDLSDELESRSLKINYVGELSRERALEYVANSDLIVNTSLFEGMSLVIAEALYFQKPIIATNTGVAAEVIEDSVNGFIINNDDVLRLSHIINRLCNDDELINSISVNQKETYSKYFDSEFYFSEHEKVLMKDV